MLFSACTASGTSESVNIVQMKRNGSNCPKGRNLDKLSLKNAGKCGKKVTSCVMRESKQKCGNFTVIAGNLERFGTTYDPIKYLNGWFMVAQLYYQI